MFVVTHKISTEGGHSYGLIGVDKGTALCVQRMDEMTVSAIRAAHEVVLATCCHRFRTASFDMGIGTLEAESLVS